MHARAARGLACTAVRQRCLAAAAPVLDWLAPCATASARATSTAAVHSCSTRNAHSIWQARSSCEARAEFSPAELNDFYGYGDPTSTGPTASIRTRLRSAAKRCLGLDRPRKSSKLQEQGKLDLSESLQRWMVQLLVRFTESELGDVPDTEERDVLLFGSSCGLITFKARLAMLLATRYDSGPKLNEAKIILLDTTAVRRKDLESLLSNRIARQREVMDELHIDEKDESTWAGNFYLLKETFRRCNHIGRAEASQLVFALCDLLSILQRLGEPAAMAEVTNELIVRYHAIAAGNAVTFAGFESESSMIAELRKRITKVIGMDVLYSGAEALQRARIEGQETTASASKHYHTLHSRGVLALTAHRARQSGGGTPGTPCADDRRLWHVWQPNMSCVTWTLTRSLSVSEVPARRKCTPRFTRTLETGR